MRILVILLKPTHLKQLCQVVKLFPSTRRQGHVWRVNKVIARSCDGARKARPYSCTRLNDMFILIRERSFPFDNITYLLFEDVIQWYRCKDIRSMSYSLFMATCRKLFGNRFVEIMRGLGFKYSNKFFDTWGFTYKFCCAVYTYTSKPKFWWYACPSWNWISLSSSR